VWKGGPEETARTSLKLLHKFHHEVTPEKKIWSTFLGALLTLFFLSYTYLVEKYGAKLKNMERSSPK